jgi:6-phosphogluconolactonase (cycloisomerase 2 family)
MASPADFLRFAKRPMIGRKVIRSDATNRVSDPATREWSVMDIRTRLTAVGITGVAASALTALFASPANAAPAAHAHRSAPQPVFVLANESSGNHVAVYDREAGGTLTAAGRYATGGAGGTLDGSVVDHLASQGALTYDRAHRLLYAVNAGSNTLTVFAVHGDRLERLQVVGSGGRFPVSVAVHDHVVYVLNARDGGSIQGFLRLGHTLLRIPAWHRALGLDPNAAPEFVNTPGQVTFSPRGNQLVVTTKANGNEIDVFNLDPFGGPGRAPTVTVDPGAVPFAAAFDREGRLDVTEAGPNAVASFVLHRDGSLTLVDRVATGQAATCWIVGNHGHLYADNAGSASVSTFDVTRDGLAAGATTATDGGTIDAAISRDQRNLYVQAGAAGTVDEFAINRDGLLTPLGSVTVPGTVGGEGIATG